jgi:hypothetical protein
VRGPKSATVDGEHAIPHADGRQIAGDGQKIGQYTILHLVEM